MSELKHFGMIDSKVHYLILGRSTHLHILIIVSCHKHAIDNMKMRRVNEQKVTIDHESFTPIIFSTAGQKGNAAKVTYKQLISLIAIKYT